MNKTIKKVFLALVFALATVAVVSCGVTKVESNLRFFDETGKEVSTANASTYVEGTKVVLKGLLKDGYNFAGWYEDPSYSGQPVTEISTSAKGDKQFYAKFVEVLSLDTYKAYVQHELDRYVERIEGQLVGEQPELVANQKALCEAAIEAGQTVEAVKEAFGAGKVAIANQIPFAEGVKTFIGLSTEEKTTILGVLETFAVANGMTGISLYENGGYQMFNPRVTLGTENYIVGYGFGTLAEGGINGDLETESNEAWKRYYHTINAQDPGTANYLNDQGSEIGDFFSYFSASFFTTYMNETKDGYEWFPMLAKANPVPVDSTDEGATAKTWRFPVYTGKDGLKYNTLSQKEDRAAFNNRPVELEDYLTVFKLLLTKKNELYRGSELANSKTGTIAGAKEYYEGSAEGFNQSLWDNVGLRVFEQDGLEYFEVEFAVPYTQYFARYYISSSLYMPIPQSFIDVVSVKDIYGFSEDRQYSPVDNTLSLGAYTLERWDVDKQIVYKKNPNFIHADTKYSIEGVHINIVTALNTDQEAGIKEFLAGKTDASGIPPARVAEFRNDPRTKKFRGDSNFKLNFNALDQETWIELFGVNGKATPSKSEEDYWTVEPALSNKFFARAISTAIDRLSFCDSRGRVPSLDFFAPNYLSDPEKGTSYAQTPEHEFAIKELLLDTDAGGFNLELARRYFQIALAELEADGLYTPGTYENPTVIEIEIAWQTPDNENTYHKEIEQFLETAFNDLSVSGGKYKLDVKFWVGSVWSDVYYNKCLVGAFDIGFGSISGNPDDPLGFLSTISTDQALSGGFTLNWAIDTNNSEADLLVYNGERYSFDGLYCAATGVAVLDKGANYSEPLVSANIVSHEKQADGSYVSVAEINIALPAITEVTLTDVVVCNYDEDETYKEESIPTYTVKVEEGKIIVTINTPIETVESYAGETGFDFYYDMVLDGNPDPGKYVSIKGFTYEYEASEGAE